jgi:uncharacterized protein YijF (DUF1287 family)
MRRGLSLGLAAIGVALLLLAAVVYVSGWRGSSGVPVSVGRGAAPVVSDQASPKAHQLAEAAMSQVGQTVRYDATYRTIAYPGGDVPIETGVCTDVLVRAFRRVGLDLQVAVHEDMSRHFSAYPHLWGLKAPDTNIDHRRVPNLQTYFARRGFAQPITSRGADYQPGDVVMWKTWGLSHTGMVSTRRSADGQRFSIVHNIGSGTRIEDMLFSFEITGHYRVY